MKTKLPLFCGLIAVVPTLILTACLSLTGGTRAHTHQWSEWTQVSGDDATEERACKIDSAHIQTRLTGTDRFTFEAARIVETSYRVNKGTLTTGELTIPAFYRPDADSEYLPVTEIGSGAFKNCTSLTSVTIPENVTFISREAFYNCESLTNITLPESLTFVGLVAFFGCKSLTSLTLPTGVTSIDILAFSGCSNLINITIPASVISIDSSAFYGCTSLTRMTVDSKNPHYASEGGILYNKAKTELIAFPSASGNVIIPAGVITISYGAFNGCADLTSITIPSSVTSIDGEYIVSFYGTFTGCTSLTSVIFAEGSQLKNIGMGTFAGCTSLANITIPEGVTSIGDGAFINCTNLTSITIPAGVTKIGMLAFEYWTASQTINILGHASQAAADTAWGSGWRGDDCRAQINYLGH